MDLNKGLSGAKERKVYWNTNQNVEKMLPFPLLGFDSDNGGEFLIITCCAILTIVNSLSTLLAAEPTTKTIMPI